MKKALAFAAAISFAAAAQAVPFASQVRVSSTAVSPGAGLTISYALNEAADSVTIEILSSGTPVATFAGTTTQGANSVVWNGTSDNASGSQVGGGTYSVRVTANKNVGGTEWREIASHQSLGGFDPDGSTYNYLFNGFSPNSFEFVNSQTSDHFGTGLGFACYAANTSGRPATAAAFTFRSDLATLDGTDGLNSRIFRLANLENQGTALQNYAAWGTSADPDNPEAFYWTGQDATAGAGDNFYYVDLANPSGAVTADPSDFTGTLNARGVVVTREGAKKYAYFAYGNSTIGKIEINASNQLAAAPTVITGTFATTTRYSRDLAVDDAGNLYYATRATNTTTGADGALFRWNADKVAGLPVATPLTESSAAWNVRAAADMLHMIGPAITPAGDVYVAFTRGTGAGIYYVGNTATGSIDKPLTAADRVVSFVSNIGSPAATWLPNTIYSNLTSDAAGNILVADRGAEQVRLFSKPGNTTQQTVAPASQNFAVTASVSDWSMY